MTAEPPEGRQASCAVLVVGAGPTGLALAAQLSAFGVDVRLVDRAADRVRESRALAMQPRTLEVLRPFGVVESLLARGNPAAQLRVHAGRRAATAPLFDIGLDDSAFPFLLFVSQAETEAVLVEHLRSRGVTTERRTTLEHFAADADGVTCFLRGPDGASETVRAAWLVGCDGAHSTVREQAGIGFRGGRYPQTFVLADLAVDGLEPGTVNVYLGPSGPLLLFPLGHPAPWRLVSVRPSGSESMALRELQDLTDASTGGRLRLRDPVWTSAFTVHHRHATGYQAGRVLLAGDAAHVHSPVGAQGMNTGIQDAVNLGWKLALVARGLAPVELVDSYDAERRPVGAYVLRFTDRAFTVATSGQPLVRAMRTHLVPRLLPVALRLRPGRRAAFRTVSQLGIRYPHSPAVQPSVSGGRGRRSGPQPGDRLPDGPVLRNGRPGWLHESLTAPAFHLLLCGPPAGWDVEEVAAAGQRWGDLLAVHHLARESGPGVQVDRGGRLLRRLRVRGAAHLLVRPDGHIGYRADHTDLAGAARWLARWLPGA